MNRRYYHHLWKRFRRLKPWYFFVIALVSGTICIISLRQNYQGMVKLRDTVYQVDKDNGDVVKALNNLRSYVYAHMNTNLASGPNAVYPPIQLKYTYDRLTQQATQQAAGANQQLYTQAQAYCQQQNSVDFSGRNRVPCIEQYVTGHGVKVTPVPDSLYKFSFVSPTWSPDLAGWSLFVTLLSAVLGFGVWVVERWLKPRVA
jgi:hypothetical protein